jgi:hypothetical protein
VHEVYEGTLALFNSLLMDPIFLSVTEYEDIINIVARLSRQKYSTFLMRHNFPCDKSMLQLQIELGNSFQ